MTLAELNAQKLELLEKANKLSAIKKKLYSKVDISTPMSQEEKQLNKEVADLFSKIDSIVREIRNMKKATSL